jgi:hypothetical protein
VSFVAVPHPLHAAAAAIATIATSTTAPRVGRSRRVAAEGLCVMSGTMRQRRTR